MIAEVCRKVNRQITDKDGFAVSQEFVKTFRRKVFGVTMKVFIRRMLVREIRVAFRVRNQGILACLTEKE